MKFDALKITDKTGREVIFRSAEKKDAKSLLKYLKVTAAETPYLIREPEEITLSIKEEEEFIQRIEDSERELMLVATVDGKHIGNCSLMSMGSFKRYRHRCDVAIALYQEYCGRGIGKMMLEAVLKVAKELGYEQAELEVVADNKTAIVMYEKLGFEQYGVFPHNVKYSGGKYADACWMMKRL